MEGQGGELVAQVKKAIGKNRNGKVAMIGRKSTWELSWIFGHDWMDL
jgi:hypothetical protein